MNILINSNAICDHGHSQQQDCWNIPTTQKCLQMLCASTLEHSNQ